MKTRRMMSLTATAVAVLTALQVAVNAPAVAKVADDHRYGAVIPADRRAAALGSGWSRSADRSWTTTGDENAFRLLVADAADGYRWRTAAALAEPGVETDRWIGNACVTGSGRRAVVVYAPRTFTNEQALFDRGGFTAVVDLTTGAVRKLPVRTSLAYFNPGCGPGEDAVLTQATDAGGGRTRLLRVDARNGAVRTRIEVPGQLTSPVPTPAGIVAADRAAVVRVDPNGTRRVLARASSTPFRLAADGADGVVFMERSGAGRARVRHVGATAVTLAEGDLSGLDVTSGRGGRVFVTGAGRTAPIERGVALSAAPAGSRISTEGGLALEPPRSAGDTVTIAARAAGTGTPMSFSITASAAAADPGNPADFDDRYCSVPRNDPRNQAMQPKPRQVEWAVDQAVRGVLTVQRPANWKSLAMPAYTPQGLFPPLPLTGGGNVPAQIMLAITAQESNMWQAARFAVPGVTANPLIGNYYGLDIYNDTEDDDWTIRWDHADCGYGVTQVTDGMRLAGRSKPGETALPYQTQRAVALDFAANVAAGLRILQSKWNETRNAGLIIGTGDPAKIESWFYAAWAYNSGFYPQAQAGQHNGAWGVGWANNPANPNYPANRGPFLEKGTEGGYSDDYTDAVHPQDWPYPEKIIGWAAHPIDALEAPDTMVSGYRKAWWTTLDAQHNATPKPWQFCDASNDCAYGAANVPDAPEVIGEPAGPCAHRNSAGQIDLKCWYHAPATWQTCPSLCGNEVLRFDPGYAYQEDGLAYPPACDLSGIPVSAWVIDDVPNGVPSVRPGCGRPWSDAGTFTLHYKPDATGHYPGKIDTHQLGMGLGGHFWMADTRSAGTLGGRLDVDGTWRFDQEHHGLGRILVHLPPLTNGTTRAYYTVKTRWGDRISVLNQRGAGNRWVSLGAFPFDGRPEVTLSSVSPGGDGSQRVAFDAVAFAPVSRYEPVKVMHWNLAGAAKNWGAEKIVDRVVTRATEQQADVLSLNEICLQQFDKLTDKLKDAGWQMTGQFQTTNRFNPQCLDTSGNEGIAVFTRGSVLSQQRYQFDDQYKLQPGSTGIGRGVACITTYLPGKSQNLKACTTHLDTGWPDDKDRRAIKEVAELGRVFGPEAQQMPFILAGDTNIYSPPITPDLGPLYPAPLGDGDFNEAFQEENCVKVQPCLIQRGGPPTFHGGKKLDYIFASRWHLTVPVGGARVDENVGTCDGDPCSDHFPVYAEIDMPNL
jgi:endonuclease/exonuclease/phosphatase family metal-dependent hydrolase